MRLRRAHSLEHWRGCGAALLLSVLACCAPDDSTPDLPREKPRLGLMTSLPIYWGEEDAFAALSGEEDASLPWVRTVIEQRYRITPLDTLAPAGDQGPGGGLSREGSPLEALSPDGSALEGVPLDESPLEGTPLEGSPLEGVDALAIIQPRGLSPADNVELDDWVRAGGKLLYVIDPMLTGEYEAALSDPRHPVVSALVPPIFARWNVALTFDEDQSQEPRLQQWQGLALPGVMAGTLSCTQAASDTPPPAPCQASGMFARVRPGQGQVTIIADAAVFEPYESSAQAEEAILQLLAHSFS